MNIGASVQGLFVQAPARIATLLSRKTMAMSRAIAGVDAQDREEGDEDADAEGEGQAVGRVLESAGECGRGPGAGSRPAAAPTGRKWSCPTRVDGHVPPPDAQEDRSGSPSRNWPSTVNGVLKIAASSRGSARRSAGTREQELVVLAAVEGEGERVSAARAHELRDLGVDRDLRELERAARRRSPRRARQRSPDSPSETSIAACTRSRSASARAKARGGRGSSWARRQAATAAAELSVQGPGARRARLLRRGALPGRAA